MAQGQHASHSVACAIALIAAVSLSCRDSSETNRDRDINERIARRMEQGKKPNRLINEKSPYLLQHAFNPVDWYPWGPEAFAKARSEQKPIFLSIGYSTCHWCHVMERESFESDAIAALLNEHFVSIKVDREERPDVDKVYMTALQGFGEGGGWPMSMFLTPDLKPFFGGTYFPPETRYGRIGFSELLRRISSAWNSDRSNIVESAETITSTLQKAIGASLDAGTPDTSLLETCFDQFGRIYDPVFGGFGGAPKFPRPSVFSFLMNYFYRTGNPQALEMVRHTLRKMSLGGIYDHMGGGFHRYSVDAEWRVPHFEKMLYDQAQLVLAYLDVYQATGEAEFAAVVREVLGYVERELTSPEGGFYSAEDADSQKHDTPDEHGEGAFYVWSRGEVIKALGAGLGELVCHYFGIEEGGNAPFDPQHEFTGKNIPYVAHSMSATASRFSMSEQEVAGRISEGRRRLFDIRSARPRPHRDDKVLTSWNGLMISAFARAYQVLGDPKHLSAANRAADFVLARLYDAETNTLTRRYRDNEAKHEAHLDDYAFFAGGLLDLYEAAGDVRRLRSAVGITHRQIELFWDEQEGGFFDTSGRDSTILLRMKEQYDGAEPSGNSVAVTNLLRIDAMLGREEWRRMADRTLSAFHAVLSKQPLTMPQMVTAYAFSIAPKTQIVVVGRSDDPLRKAILAEVHARFMPHKVVMIVEPGEQRALATLAPFVASLTTGNGKAAAFICKDFVCRLPTSETLAVREMLGGRHTP